MSMTISQGLRQVAKLKGQLNEYLKRAQGAVTYIEGEKPAFDFDASMEAADKAREALVKLETAIRVTNATTQVVGREGMTLAEATCRLQETKGRIAWLRSLTVEAQPAVRKRTGHTYDAERRLVEVFAVTQCALPEALRAERIEKLQAEFDALNDAVETTNHRVNLNF